MKWQNEFERREKLTRLKLVWKIRLADDLNLSERTRLEFFVFYESYSMT